MSDVIRHTTRCDFDQREAMASAATAGEARRLAKAEGFDRVPNPAGGKPLDICPDCLEQRLTPPPEVPPTASTGRSAEETTGT